MFLFLSNGHWSFPATRTIYQGPMKVICSPGLNCYSCPAATTFCPIGSLQQVLGGIRLTLETGQFYIGLYVIGIMGVIGGSVGRMVCGWICPFGLFQELLYKIASPKFSIWPWLTYLKYGLLLLTVILLPLFAIDEFGSGDPWFCKYFCPAGTLEAALPMIILQPALREKLGMIFLFKAVILVIFVVWAVVASRPFCRVACPLGGFYALFSKIRLVQLSLDNSRCNQCNACRQVCPMDIPITASVNSPECILCFSCLKACKTKALGVEIGGVKIGACPGSCRPPA